jgi:hypothetical protein
MSAATVKKTFGELFKTPHNGVFAIDVGCQEAISQGDCLFAAFHQAEKTQRPGLVDSWTPDSYRSALLHELINSTPLSDLTTAFKIELGLGDGAAHRDVVNAAVKR